MNNYLSVKEKLEIEEILGSLVFSKGIFRLRKILIKSLSRERRSLLFTMLELNI